MEYPYWTQKPSSWESSSPVDAVRASSCRDDRPAARRQASRTACRAVSASWDSSPASAVSLPTTAT